MTEISLPAGAKHIIETLEKNGYEAYAVGGCVRDSIMGKEPKDWDICTCALPEQTMSVFNAERIIETGLKHGTITLMLDDEPYEITTFRVDGKYKDNRRPENIKFVSVLKRDLARRDFTINALAYSPSTGLVDYYGGCDDIEGKRIKCVGNPDKRFGEDALRIMRALRFASVLGYEIEDNTALSIHKNRLLLKNIAAERIASELGKLLTGCSVDSILRDFADVLIVFIPELEPMIGFKQNTPYHIFDVWEHTIASVIAAPPDHLYRLTMLLHDIAKPVCYTQENGIGHFYNHGRIGSEMVQVILKRLRYDNDTVDMVSSLVLYHDTAFEPRVKLIRKQLSYIGEDRLRKLIILQKADASAQAPEHRDIKLAALDKSLPIIDEIIEQKQCFSLKDLAVNGKDLIEAGITDGISIGKVLNRLLDMVIDELLVNEKTILLEKAQILAHE